MDLGRELNNEFLLENYNTLCTNFARLVGENKVLNEKMNLVESKCEIVYQQVRFLENKIKQVTPKKRKK